MFDIITKFLFYLLLQESMEKFEKKTEMNK